MGREGAKEKVGNREGEAKNGKGGGSGKGERAGKGEGGLDLDICSGAPEFLVTPLAEG